MTFILGEQAFKCFSLCLFIHISNVHSYGIMQGNNVRHNASWINVIFHLLFTISLFNLWFMILNSRSKFNIFYINKFNVFCINTRARARRYFVCVCVYMIDLFNRCSIENKSQHYCEINHKNIFLQKGYKPL